MSHDQADRILPPPAKTSNRDGGQPPTDEQEGQEAPDETDPSAVLLEAAERPCQLARPLLEKVSAGECPKVSVRGELGLRDV